MTPRHSTDICLNAITKLTTTSASLRSPCSAQDQTQYLVIYAKADLSLALCP